MLFVWIMSRLNHDLRSKIKQQSTYSSLSIAAPRDPPALMDLIETVMLKGDMDGEGSEEEKAARLQYDRNCLFDYGLGLGLGLHSSCHV
jgi:hypothetical protein